MAVAKTTRAQRMNGALGGVFVTAAVGLFAPVSWHAFLFAVILLWCVIGLYDRGDVAEGDPAA